MNRIAITTHQRKERIRRNTVAKIFERELEKLKKKIFELCAMVEENFKDAIKSIVERDENLAQKVVDEDDRIDKMEVEVEEDCLKLLALHQPVAVDLRFLISALKINNDLERIGDLAVNVVERGFQIFKSDPIVLEINFNEMFTKSMAMVKKSIDAFIHYDSALAKEVCILDDEVDAFHRKMFDIFKDKVKKNQEQTSLMLHYLSISRHLERVGDHATNIAEDVIYMVDGDIIRHGKQQFDIAGYNA